MQSKLAESKSDEKASDPNSSPLRTIIDKMLNSQSKLDSPGKFLNLSNMGYLTR